MKYTFKIYIFLSSIFISGNIYSTQRTVSNDPLRPAQFNNLPSAIAASNNGDTILVAGSPNIYIIDSPLNITKKLVIIGEGVNNPDGFNTLFQNTGDQSTNVFRLGRLNLTESSNESKIIGISFNCNVEINPAFSGSILSQRTLSDIHFIGCRFQKDLWTYDIFNNCKVVHSLFSSGSRFIPSGVPSNFLMENCVFSNGQVNSNASNCNLQVLLKNCLFLNRTSSIFAASTQGLIIENCIFYTAEPTAAYNCIFNNNITYLCNNNNLPPAGAGNTGTGNIVNSNPLFINYPPLGADFAWTHNYGLQAGSPAIGAGTGGTNIGLTGGTYPLNQLKGNSPLPVVTSLSLPNSSVPLNGTLQGNIQAKVRN